MNEGAWLGRTTPEVAVVDRCDLDGLEAFGRGNDRRIDRAQRKVAIACDELGDPYPIGRADGFGTVAAGMRSWPMAPGGALVGGVICSAPPWRPRDGRRSPRPPGRRCGPRSAERSRAASRSTP